MNKSRFIISSFSPLSRTRIATALLIGVSVLALLKFISSAIALFRHVFQ